MSRSYTGIYPDQSLRIFPLSLATSSAMLGFKSHKRKSHGLIRRSAIEAREQGYRWDIGNYARLPVDKGHLR